MHTQSLNEFLKDFADREAGANAARAHKVEARQWGAVINTMKANLAKLEAFVSVRAEDGRLWSDEDKIIRDLAAGMNALLRVRPEEDESDGNDKWQDEADYRYDEQRERAA